MHNNNQAIFCLEFLSLADLIGGYLLLPVGTYVIHCSENAFYSVVDMLE